MWLSFCIEYYCGFVLSLIEVLYWVEWGLYWVWFEVLYWILLWFCIELNEVCNWVWLRFCIEYYCGFVLSWMRFVLRSNVFFVHRWCWFQMSVWPQKRWMNRGFRMWLINTCAVWRRPRGAKHTPLHTHRFCSVCVRCVFGVLFLSIKCSKNVVFWLSILYERPNDHHMICRSAIRCISQNNKPKLLTSMLFHIGLSVIRQPRWRLYKPTCCTMWPWSTKPVIRVTFCEIEIYASSESWINNISIDAWFVMIGQYL